MQTTNRIFDDIAKLTTGLLGLAVGMRRDIKERFQDRAEGIAQKMDLVSRQDFEIVRDMAQQARLEAEGLKKRLAKLEQTAKKQSTTKK